MTSALHHCRASIPRGALVHRFSLAALRFEARQSWSALLHPKSRDRQQARGANSPLDHVARTACSRARLAIPLLLAIALHAQDTGSLAGTILDSVTHQPIKKARVIATPVVPPATQNTQQLSTTSGSDGSYSFTNLPPGPYYIIATQQLYPPSRDVPAQADVKPGERTTQNVELTPGASISGKILDEDGDPLPGCFVQLRHAANPEQFATSLGGNAGVETSEYRLYGIPAGRYLVSALCPTPVFEPRPFSAGPDPPPSLAYPLQFYPNGRDSKSAMAIDLTAGSEKSGIDFQMKPAHVTQVNGRFSPDGADLHQVGAFSVQLLSPDPSIPPAGANIDINRGTFRFPRVFPGSYVLIAESGNRNQQIGASQRVEVRDEPLEVSLELKNLITLNGKVEIDGNGQRINPASINFYLSSADFRTRSPIYLQPREDRTFTTPPLLPGRWLIRSNFAYIKSIRAGSDDITDRPLDLTAGDPGPLTIVIGTDLGMIEGSAPPGMAAVAVNVATNASYWSGRSPAGHIRIANLPPGRYR